MKYFVPVILALIVFQFSSCKDDEVPPAVISFTAKTSTVSEGVGTAAINLTLDKAAPGDIVVNFTIIGSAQSGVDYESTGSATIVNGSTEAQLAINIIDDNIFEFDPELASVLGETLEITLSGVTGNGKLSEDVDALTHVLIVQENDPVATSLKIELSWDAGGSTPGPGDVDMDLILFLIDPVDGPQILAASNKIGTVFEGIIIGTPAPDGIYALAYRYFEGTSNNLIFTAKFTAEKGTLPGGVLTKSYSAVYTQANVNGDESANATVQIVQTFEKKGSDYISISEIDVPNEGSRRSNSEGKAPTKGTQIGIVIN